jgi:hypothetical protein
MHHGVYNKTANAKLESNGKVRKPTGASECLPFALESGSRPLASIGFVTWTDLEAEK